jgi:hypothetical protein
MNLKISLLISSFSFHLDATEIELYEVFPSIRKWKICPSDAIIAHNLIHCDELQMNAQGADSVGVVHMEFKSAFDIRFHFLATQFCTVNSSFLTSNSEQPDKLIVMLHPAVESSTRLGNMAAKCWIKSVLVDGVPEPTES